jgi:hypothetical protein
MTPLVTFRLEHDVPADKSKGELYPNAGSAIEFLPNHRPKACFGQLEMSN